MTMKIEDRLIDRREIYIARCRCCGKVEPQVWAEDSDALVRLLHREYGWTDGMCSDCWIRDLGSKTEEGWNIERRVIYRVHCRLCKEADLSVWGETPEEVITLLHREYWWRDGVCWDCQLRRI